MSARAWNRWRPDWILTTSSRCVQSLHHLVAKAPWSDESLLGEVRNRVLPTMQKQGPVVAWIVDDTGFPEEGHAFGGGRAPVLRTSRETG